MLTDWVRYGKQTLRTVEIRAIDAYLRIDTTSQLEERAPTRFRGNTDQKHYESLDYVYLSGVLKHLDLSAADVFYDIGCGAGRVLCLAARRVLRRVVGVEIVPSLADQAARNLGRLRGRRSPYFIVVADAVTHDYSDGTVFVLYNPFGAQTLRLVLARIKASVEAHPRTVRLAYLNPEHEDVFADSHWLRPVMSWHPTLYRTRTSIWSGDPAIAYESV